MSEETRGKEQEVEGSELTPKDQMDRAKKNLVYLGMFSVFMLFAGFSSGYYVSMGDNFWIKAPLPMAFWISTGIILLSSITYQMAIVFNRKSNVTGLRISIIATFLLGIAFAYSQFKGYGQLMENGIHPTGSGIVVSEGRYGDYFSVKMDDEHIDVNGNDYLAGNHIMKGKELKDFQDFMAQFLEYTHHDPIKLKGDYERFTIYYRDSETLRYIDGTLKMQDSSEVLYLDRKRLSAMARHIVDSRGDFYVHGEMGKDFHILYKGGEVTYKDRELYFKGKKLSASLQRKIRQSADTSSSYLYVITFMHLLHILVTLLYLIRVVIRSFTGVISSTNSIGLQMGALFWHFLGLLWLYLLLFLLFIH